VVFLSRCLTAGPSTALPLLQTPVTMTCADEHSSYRVRDRTMVVYLLSFRTCPLDLQLCRCTARLCALFYHHLWGSAGAIERPSPNTNAAPSCAERELVWHAQNCRYLVLKTRQEALSAHKVCTADEQLCVAQDRVVAILFVKDLSDPSCDTFGRQFSPRISRVLYARPFLVNPSPATPLGSPLSHQ
jgi:hypothetical protein